MGNRKQTQTAYPDTEFLRKRTMTALPVTQRCISSTVAYSVPSEIRTKPVDAVGKQCGRAVFECIATGY